MRRVLIVAYYFPPLGGIGSIRVSSLARFLPSHGWDPTVLAPSHGAYHLDPALRFPEEKVVRSPSLEFSRAGKRLLRAGGSDTEAAQVTGARSSLRRMANAVLYFPDAQIGWFPPAVVTARRRLRHPRFDAIFSSSFPITGHLIGLRLHRWLGIPWIAEFRDPWSQMMANGTRRRAALAVERRLAHEASGVLMTSPSWAALHSDLWHQRVDTLLNGHDGDRPAPPKTTDTITLAYLGTYYPKTQSLTAVWEAVQRTRRSGALAVERIRLVGDPHPALLADLRARGLGDLVEVTGFLSHDQALRAIDDATVVLAAGPADASGLLRGHIPAKIAEYLAGPRPVIFVGDPASDAAELVRRYAGTWVVATGDTEGAVAALQNSSTWTGERSSDDLSRLRLAGQLAQILDGAVR